jgi:uroporphyrinogen-III synthase
MRVLITRPRGEAEGLETLLAGRGVEAMVEPLIAIHPMRTGPLPLDGLAALLFTSANGVEAFAAREARRDLPVFAVGARTAEAARQAGFARVESADGAVEDLARLVRARLTPAAGALLHPCGADRAGDLAGLLAPQGFEFRQAALYEAVAAPRFSGAAIAALRGGLLDAVLLFSPRTAATFVSLARKAGLASACARLDAICLSQAVADAASGVAWRALRVAPRPEQAALLELIAPSSIQQPATPSRAIQPREATLSETREPAESAATPEPAPTAPEAPPVISDPMYPAVPDSATPSISPPPPPPLPPQPLPPIEPLRPNGSVPPTSSAPPAPRAKPGNLRLALLLGLPLAFIVALLATLPNWGPFVGIGSGADNADKAAEDARLAQIEATLGGLGPLAKATPSLAVLPDQLRDDERKLGALERSYAELAAKPEPKSAIDPAQLSALGDQLTSLKSDQAKLGGDLDAIRARLDALEAAAKKASAADLRPAAFLLALGQLRTALASSGAYGQALDGLALLAAQDESAKPDIAALREHAAAGVPTLSALQASYDTASLAAARAAIQPEGGGLLRRIWARLRQLVVIRRTDADPEGDGADAVLARAGARLQAGDLKGAVAALGGLQGKPAEAMAPWLEQAHARLAVEAALDNLSARATALLGEVKP